MRDRRVDEDRPQADEPQHGREFHSLGKCAGDQGRRDDGERHLKADVHAFGNGRGQRIGIADAALADVAQDVLEEHPIEPADERRAGAKRHAVGQDSEQDGDETSNREARHHGVANILLAHHAAVEQPEARDRHHQHQRDGCQHPRGVAGIGRTFFEYLAAAGRRPGGIFRQGDISEYETEKRYPQQNNHPRYESLARVGPEPHCLSPCNVSAYTVALSVSPVLKSLITIWPRLKSDVPSARRCWSNLK